MCDHPDDYLDEHAEDDEACESSFSEIRIRNALMFHLLYTMEAHDYVLTLEDVVIMFNKGFETVIDDNGAVVQQAQAIIDNRSMLDDTIKPLLANWRIDRIGICTRLILRQSLWQLLYTQEPPKIIVNEAIVLAKCFSERDAYKFVNGVLDELLRRLDKQS